MSETTNTARSPPPVLRLSAEDWIARGAVVIIATFLLVVLALPLWSLLSKSLQNTDGHFVGLANFAAYVATPQLVSSLWNSLQIASITTAIVIPLAFAYAYALTRTCMPAKGAFTSIAMIPLFAPSLLSAISLIYIFGNQGFLKSWLQGGTIYGPLGIVLAQIFYGFPHAVMILITALRLADGRLYEAAAALGTSPLRTFCTVTLPGIKYGLVGSGFVIFTLVVTDFGVAKVIGGQFNVLATDAYKQVVGQQNFQMGAVVGLILLVPAAIAFAADRIIQRRQVALISARAVPYDPKPHALSDRIALLYCAALAAIVLGIIGVAVWASFITYWPYNLSLSLKNYDFAETDSGGWSPYLTSLKMAAITSLSGTPIVFFGAYLVEKGRGMQFGRGLIHLLAMMPMAVPGLVLGLGYVFFFNARGNPLGALQGTVLLLAFSTIAHFYTTAHVTAVSALKQLDAEFEAISASLQVPFYRTLMRVTVPICLPAILDIAVYLFVNAMTTVSAVVFLYGAETKLASISIVQMDESGASAPAAAMATLILMTALVIKALQVILDRVFLARLQAWRTR